MKRRVGVGIGISVGVGSRLSKSRGWIARYTNSDDVLFIGEISKIIDGKLYNQKKDATDYLTVGGSAGSYTFQAPNTAPYIAADTSYIWFDPDESQRTTTESELVSYDFPRTPVKYLDDSPNSIQCVMILTADLTGSELNNLFRSFRLHPLWNNSWNDYGVLKSNRGLEQLIYGSSFVFEEETEALVLRYTEPPSITLKVLINDTIKSYKAAGIWAKRDYIGHLNMHTEQASLLNWKGDYFNFTKLSILTWEQYLGFTATGAGQYLTNSYKENTAGNQLALNDACFTNKFNAWVSGTGTQMMGANSPDNAASSRIWYINGKYVGIQSINAATTADISKAAIVNVGRINNTKIRIRVDGAFAQEITSNSTRLVDVTETILAIGTGSYLMTNKRICYHAKGAYLTDEQAALEKTIIENFDTKLLLL